MLGYQLQEKYLLHEFVLMPDHFHLLITPTSTLERALQLIRGGFSFRLQPLRSRLSPRIPRKNRIWFPFWGRS